jgi:hypothetical protein
MATPTGAGPSWDDLVAALVSTRTDHATARFDEVLAAAEAAGTIDGPTARTLRWWQRESVRSVTEHIVEVLPATIERMAVSDAAARASVEASERAWTAVAPAPQAAPVAQAVGDEGRSHTAASDPVDHGHDGPIGTVTSLPTRTPLDQPEPPHRPGPGFTSTLFAERPTTPPGDTGVPHARLLAGGLTVLADGPIGSFAPTED